MRLPVFEDKEHYQNFIQSKLYSGMDYKLDTSEARLFTFLSDKDDWDILFMIHEVYGNSNHIVLPNGRSFTLTEVKDGVRVYYDGITQSASE